MKALLSCCIFVAAGRKTVVLQKAEGGSHNFLQETSVNIAKICSGTSYTDAKDVGCNGWKGLSLTECQQKCHESAQADNCPAKQCKAAVWYAETNWCHLYESCPSLEDKREATSLVKQAPGKVDLQAIENSLVSLAKEGGSSIPDGFINQVESLTKSMKEHIIEQSRASQMTLNASWEDFLSCSPAGQHVSNLTASSLAHRTCRSDESKMYKELMSVREICSIKNGTAKAYCDAFRAMDQFPPAGKCKWKHATSKSTLDYMKALSDHFLAHHNAWLQNKSLCESHSNISEQCFNAEWSSKQFQLQQKRAECDHRQYEVEQLACGPGNQCLEYKLCYSERKTAWESTNQTVAAQEASFLSQYHGWLRIDCLVDALLSHWQTLTPLTEDIDACQQKTYADPSYYQPLFVSYFNVSENPVKACSQISGGPGSQTFNDEYFHDMPHGTALAPCSSDCCAGAEFALLNFRAL